MRPIVICGLSVCAILFHIISQTARFSEKKFIEHKMCVFYTVFFLQHFSLKPKFNEVSYIYLRLRVKFYLFLSDFKERLIFSTEFRKIININFVKIRTLKAELFHSNGRTDRQTDMTKDNCYFS